MFRIKNICSIFLVILVFILMFNITVFAKTKKKSNINYKYNKNDCVLVISGTGDISNYKSFWDTPWEQYRNKAKYIKIKKGINCVGKNAFSDFYKLKKVVLSSTVYRINEQAFKNCYDLKKIDLKNIKNIGKRAFEDCHDLKSINLKKLTSLGKASFIQSGLKSVKFGKKLKTISEGSFEYCDKLSTIKLPKNIKRIHSNAFTPSEDFHLYIHNKEIILNKSFLGGIDSRLKYYIHSYKNSNAEKFAEKYDAIEFILIDK